jgi:cytochrome c-type biogenesis protein CcmF
MAVNLPVELTDLGINLRFTRLDPASGKATIEVKEVRPDNSYVVVQAIRFPGINLVWIGKIMLMGGFLLSMFSYLSRRFRTEQAA